MQKPNQAAEAQRQANMQSEGPRTASTGDVFLAEAPDGTAEGSVISGVIEIRGGLMVTTVC